MQKALCPGRFDPPTLGHISLLSRASQLCDHLVVGIGENLVKGKSLLTTDEKVKALEKSTKQFPNIEITSFSGLVTDFAKKMGAQVLIRGLRSVKDLEYEREMALANFKLTGIETIFLLAEPGASHISSSLIRELAANGAPLSDFIPQDLETLMHSRIYTK